MVKEFKSVFFLNKNYLKLLDCKIQLLCAYLQALSNLKLVNRLFNDICSLETDMKTRGDLLGAKTSLGFKCSTPRTKTD